MSLQLLVFLTLCAGHSGAAPLKDEVQANITMISLTVAKITGTFIEVKDPEEADSDFKKSVHLSTALASIVLLLFLQFHI